MTHCVSPLRAIPASAAWRVRRATCPLPLCRDLGVAAGASFTAQLPCQPSRVSCTGSNRVLPNCGEMQELLSSLWEKWIQAGAGHSSQDPSPRLQSMKLDNLCPAGQTDGDGARASGRLPDWVTSGWAHRDTDLVLAEGRVEVAGGER